MSSLISQALLIGSPSSPGPGLRNADQFWERRVETTPLPGLLWNWLFHVAKLRSTAIARRMLSLPSALRCSYVLLLPLQITSGSLPPLPALLSKLQRLKPAFSPSFAPSSVSWPGLRYRHPLTPAHRGWLGG